MKNKFFTVLFLIQLVCFVLTAILHIFGQVSDKALIVSTFLMLLFALWNMEQKLDEGQKVNIDMKMTLQEGRVKDIEVYKDGEKMFGGLVGSAGYNPEDKKDKMN